MTERAIGLVWADFGGVLSPPYSELFARFEARTGISRVQLESAAFLVAREFGVAPLAPLELALVTQAEWGSRVEQQLHESFPALEFDGNMLRDFGRYWFDGATLNRPMVDALESARRDYGAEIGIVTNNVVEWEPHWWPMLANGPKVEFVVDSCRIGVRKPDPRFFAHACAIAQVEPASCLLIDDSHGNCAEATRQGWSVVHFRNTEQAVGEMTRLLGERNR